MHIFIRSAFGVGEAGNFPASIKTVAEWFPKRERALATGIFNSGSNFGAMIAALFVPWCMIHFGDAAGLENGVHPHRRGGISLADFLVLALRHADETKAAVQGRIRLHSH